MKQISVTDTVNMPADVRISQSEPDNGDYVNLYKRANGNWQAQFWMRTNCGQLVADYGPERETKGRALDDAFERALDEDIPFVMVAREERSALPVPSRVHN